MRNKIIVAAVTVMLWLAALLCPVTVSAQDAEDLAQEIWKYEMEQAGITDHQEYLDTCLTPYAGSGTEWLVICLRESRPTLDYSEYGEALDGYMSANQGLKAADYLRICLAKAAIDADASRIEDVCREYAGQDGIMSCVYGLILANAGDCLTQDERVALAGRLVKMQFADGGFAVSGEYGDADVTAMALQALAPYRDEFADATEAALQRLSKLQNDDGGYASYGVENAESCAQVLMALCALDIDYREDARFIKNGNTVWDAMCQYACDGGGFAHIRGGLANKMATAQVLMAAVCVNKYDSGDGFIYDFTGVDGEDDKTGSAGDGTASDEMTESESGAESESQVAAETAASENTAAGRLTGTVIKIVLVSLITACAVAALIAALVAGKTDRRRILWIIVPAAVLIAAVVLSRIETKDEHYATLEVKGDVRTYISVTGYDGEILGRRAVMTESGNTVFEQLQNALAAEQINLDYGGTALLGNVYVRGIGGLSEFDHGSLSGWTYRVNGEYPNVSCASYELTEGDYVEWIYTEDGAKGGDGE